MENVPRSFRKDLPKILLIVFTLLLLFIPAAKQFYADTRKPELAFADEHLDLHYSYEIKEDTQTILWTLSLKKSSIPSKLKVQLSSRVNTILEVSGYPLGENWRFDGNNCLEEIAIDQKQSELQINVETQIDPNQKNSYLDVDLSGEVSKLDEHGKEKLEPTQFKNQQKDIRLAAQNPLMDSELRKVGIIDQNLVVPNEQKLHNKSEDTVIIDLKDYLNETIFSKAEFMVRSEGIWEKYSISKHGSLNKTTPIRFYYEWTLEKVFANKDLRENVEKYQHQGMEVLFSHTFKLDNSLFLGIAEGSTTEEYSIKSPDKQEIFGTFTIRKGVGQEAHLWKTVWNEESWNSDVLNGNMYFMSTIVVNQETSKEEITILDDDYIQEIVEIQKDVSGYSLSKQHRYTHDYIELLTIEENEVPVKTTPITWQTSIAPLTEGTQDKIVLKNLFIQDKDVSNDFETSSRKGVAFQFPGAGKYAEAWQQYFMKKKIPFFEVRNEKTGLLYNEGTDYSLKYKSYDDGMNNGFEIQFHKDIDNEILITYTTLTTPYHPADSIDNRVMSDTSNFGKRTAEASTSLYRHGIEKKGEDIGFGRVRWTVFYYRDKNTGAESFIDKISKGKILIDTLEVQDESGASGEAVDGDFYQIDYKGSQP